MLSDILPSGAAARKSESMCGQTIAMVNESCLQLPVLEC